jgi:hypothetical protein
MEKLISELTRLYLPPGAMPADVLERHLLGEVTVAVSLATADKHVRAIVIPFDKIFRDEEGQHWSSLCMVANVLQSDLGLPMAAVSISGSHGYRLWLSFEAPIPATEAERFLELLRLAYLPERVFAADTVVAPVELPPCLDRRTGKWAAFIHPGMGASFADESGLEMAPPLAGQVGFLEELESISPEQFRKALDILQQAHAASMPAAPGNAALVHDAMARNVADTADTTSADGLLLKDATLEDIVKFLHARNIEPTFRHLMPRQ